MWNFQEADTILDANGVCQYSNRVPLTVIHEDGSLVCRMSLIFGNNVNPHRRQPQPNPNAPTLSNTGPEPPDPNAPTLSKKVPRHASTQDILQQCFEDVHRLRNKTKNQEDIIRDLQTQIRHLQTQIGNNVAEPAVQFTFTPLPPLDRRNVTR